MGSKGRMPPPHLRRPHPGPGIIHPDAFGPGMRPQAGAFSPFDMLPHPEVMEQKLAAQHVEMQKIATENQRLASTHGSLRQELAAAQHELQMLHAQIGAVKTEREQQMRDLMDKIGKMESELQATEPVKLELQQARGEAQNLVVARQELISKVQQLTQDLQKAHSDVQQIPALMSELDGLRQEYQHCRVTYDYEKKLYNDHLESLQVMEKDYMNMAREVEKLRAELTNIANINRRTGGPYGGSGYNENEVSGHYSMGHNTYDDSYGTSQGRAPPSGAAASGTPGHAGAPSAHTPAGPGYDASRGPGYDAPRGPSYDAHRGPSYDAQGGPGYGGPHYDAQRQRGAGYAPHWGAGYDVQRGPGYDVQRGTGFDAQRGPGYDGQWGPGYDTRVAGYDGQGGLSAKNVGYDVPRGAGNPQGPVAPPNNAHYGSATPPNRGASGYEAPPPNRGASGYEAPPRGGGGGGNNSGRK